MEEPEICPQCKKQLDSPCCRLVQDSCGHKKCRLCLLNDEVKCLMCRRHPKKRRINHTAVITCRSKVCDEVSFRDSKNSKNAIKKEIPSQETVISEEKKLFYCEICKKEFNVKSHLRSHMLAHQDRRPFSCDKCDKKFKERSKLNRHKFVHARVRSFTCSECEKSFINKENLRTHKLIHRPEKAYSCNKCDAKFNHSSNLKKHLQRHSSERSHKCEQCGKMFKLKCALAAHKRGHMKLRPNKCKTCSKTFVHAKDLQRHELIHLDVKGYSCGICGTGFRRKDNLSRHTKNTHPTEKPMVIRNVIKKKVEKEIIIDKPNAINVITTPPSQIAKDSADDKRESSIISFINLPLKLAFKTPAFKNNYNIHRDYVEPKILDPINPVNIYEKILNSSPHEAPSQSADNPNASLSACERILAPFSAPSHYETSFDNNKHAVIKNIKFKLPAKYTNIKSERTSPVQPLSQTDGIDGIEEKDGKTYAELRSLGDGCGSATASVIVNTSGNNNYYDLHWRRRTAQYLSSKYS